MKNIIGILGGMGPAATADMFQKFIQLTPAHCDQEHIPLVISSIPLQLTEEGKLFHSQARNILKQLEYNLDELLGQNSQNKPNITFAAAHSLSLSVMPELIKNINQSNKNFIY